MSLYTDIGINRTTYISLKANGQGTQRPVALAVGGGGESRGRSGSIPGRFGGADQAPSPRGENGWDPERCLRRWRRPRTPKRGLRGEGTARLRDGHRSGLAADRAAGDGGRGALATSCRPRLGAWTGGARKGRDSQKSCLSSPWGPAFPGCSRPAAHEWGQGAEAPRI